MKTLVSLIFVSIAWGISPLSAFAAQCAAGDVSGGVDVDSIVIGKNVATIALRNPRREFTEVFQYAFSETSSSDGIHRYSGRDFEMTYDTRNETYDIVAVRPGGYLVPSVKFELRDVTCE
jgi:hypothetical protein